MHSTRRAFLSVFPALIAHMRSSAYAELATPALRILFHVVRDAQGTPVVGPGFIPAAVDRANELYAPYGLAFRDAGQLALPARHALLRTRADRDALLPYVRRGAIHCMVVATLMDVDEPGRERRGVHWYARGAPRPHQVILSALAEPRVLGHELGHYLGLPEHRHVPGNLMGYLWGEGDPTLDEDQVARLKRTVARMRARGELS